MFSLNVPVPGQLKRVASELHPELTRFERIRERHTLVAKRFDTTLDDDADSLPRLRERLRPLLREYDTGGQRDPAGIDLRVTGLDYFETPARGTGPVVFLAVESDGLRALHRRLCESFGTVSGIEGGDYVPHVTLARGGRVADAEDLVERTSVDPIEWTATELHVWDSRYREAAARLPLR
ncbi:2'-5' RNA ligase family protein [Halobellus rufus]|uniref:2'-5' RNA ligase family protein n=1 Tax=Halobellus rufus TaxID=1448860 RepID=UPI000679B6C9|nr:2'-5' RNA ligase family protein [Halobellus rufus]